MKNFILFVAVVCGGASFLFYTAAREAPGRLELGHSSMQGRKLALP